jgi:hypothetical protein
MVDDRITGNIERFVEAELKGRKHPGSSLSMFPVILSSTITTT